MSNEHFKKFLETHKVTTDARRSSKQHRGEGGGFGDRYVAPKLDDGEPPGRLILFPGSYKMEVKVGKKGEIGEMERQYYIVYHHYYKTKNRFATCSAGLKLDRVGDDFELGFGDEACPACFHINDGKQAISRQMLHVFNAVLLGEFHLVDSDKTDADGKPYKEYVNCEGKRCAHCNNGADKVHGRRIYWPLGKRGVGALLTHADTVLSTRCRCGGKLSPAGFQCGECHEILRDLSEDPMKPKELMAYRLKSVKCPNCSNVDIPEEVPECSDCNSPTPLELWDVVLSVGKSGQGTDTNIMITDWEIVSKDLRDSIENKMRAYDFAAHIYKPLAPAAQAKRLEIPNPYDDDDGERGGVDWSNED